MTTLTDEQYEEVQASIQLIVSIVRNLPLDVFVERAERALSVGAFVDPTLHARAAEKLRLLVKTAKKFREVQEMTDAAVAAGVFK